MIPLTTVFSLHFFDFKIQQKLRNTKTLKKFQITSQRPFRGRERNFSPDNVKILVAHVHKSP